MQLSFTCFVSLVTLLFPTTLHGFTIGDSFEVQPGCDAGQRALLDDFVREALDLIDTTIQGINNYDNDDVVRELFGTFFDIKAPNTGQSDIKSKLTYPISKPYW